MAVWITTIISARRPSHVFWAMMKISAVKAWAPRKAGWMKASPMKPPIGSTSSLTMLAISAGLADRAASGRKRRNSATSS